MVEIGIAGLTCLEDDDEDEEIGKKKKKNFILKNNCGNLCPICKENNLVPFIYHHADSNVQVCFKCKKLIRFNDAERNVFVVEWIGIIDKTKK